MSAPPHGFFSDGSRIVADGSRKFYDGSRIWADVSRLSVRWCTKRGYSFRGLPGMARGWLPPGLGCASGALRGSSIARCLTEPVRCAGSKIPRLSDGSGGLRAWLCVFVLVYDALRGVFGRRILKLPLAVWRNFKKQFWRVHKPLSS